MHRNGGSVPGKGDHVKSNHMLTLGYMGLLLLVSSFPVTPGTQSTWDFAVPFSPASQDFLHIPAYCLLALLWAKTLKDNGTETRLSLVAAVVVTSAYGAMTELSQVWVPGRCASFLDWQFDSYGALAATGLFGIGQFFMAFEGPGRNLQIQGTMGLTAGSRSCQGVLDSRSETTAGRGPRQLTLPSPLAGVDPPRRNPEPVMHRNGGSVPISA